MSSAGPPPNNARCLLSDTKPMSISMLNVAAIGARMSEGFENRGPITRYTWPEAQRLGRRGLCGEIRSAGDLARVPKEKLLRAVYVPDERGGAIRWAEADLQARVLAGQYHDSFVCKDDRSFPTHTGWLKLRSDGALIVKGRNGE